MERRIERGRGREYGQYGKGDKEFLFLFELTLAQLKSPKKVTRTTTKLLSLEQNRRIYVQGSESLLILLQIWRTNLRIFKLIAAHHNPV